ncbi:LRR receptor-like serine/threonine-protein kinase RPK2 [Actinidia eriantha]|uniref:LRR receptor-like serine/threonine-protein kinase RPK2 n=1 Tax=Actinidia eriantha TaxID=165200 RepID=UPI00258E2F34|nr:LRR receptor-like serine/threonine-protein kinase RPK2 [Actinidia eriantha]
MEEAAATSRFLNLIMVFLVALIFIFTFNQAAAMASDAIALLALKRSISSDPSNLLSSWNPSSSNHCNWYAVHCHPLSLRVMSLNITSTAKITGFLSPFIGNLTQLRTLSIPHHLFSGQIPPQIGNLRALQILELQGNNLSGSIPYHLSPSLRMLNLSSNTLSGPIPGTLIGLGRLTSLDLSNNQLSGAIKVLGGKCESLSHLKLSNNYLVQTIPRDIAKCSNLTTLLLDGNIIEGGIPPEIGLIPQLRILDVSRNSLADRIPRELANCRKLSVVVLTNLDKKTSLPQRIGEFNAFEGGIPYELLLLPNLEIFWAPRANLGGRLPRNWTNSCSLRILNLGQNYFIGSIPDSMGLCKNLTFLDLSSNGFQGYLPWQLQVPCMVYFNVSRNSLSGRLPKFSDTSCDISMISYGQHPNFLDVEGIQRAHANIPFFMNTSFGSDLDYNLLVIHDFSWNAFSGSLPSFSLKNNFFLTNGNTSYRLLVNNNKFNGSLPGQLFSNCTYLKRFSANLSVNQISGALYWEFLLNCLQLTGFEAAQNHIGGQIPPEIGTLKMLQRLDLSRNMLSGSLPDQLGELKDLEEIYLQENNLTGEIPAQFGLITSLMVLDLSQNALTGSIPRSLANATGLQAALLDHNRLSGEIPASFSTLINLVTLDISFNNLSGHIPHLQHPNDCDHFRGNQFLSLCPDPYSAPPTGLPVPLEVQKRHSQTKMKSFAIAMAISASLVLFILVAIVLVLAFGRRKLSRLASKRRKVVVTFVDAPTELNYDNVIAATGNFSIRNLIGTGGFGSTYKAELVPGFCVAVKRLSFGRFQGIQQFDAEIQTLGRIRHKNLVTLIGYYVGEAEMFLIYNYLSGGNLETFIHKRSDKNVEWPMILKIAIDIAKALAFLHYSCVPRIVHRDIKPSNILLDEEFNAYLSDFGLARLLEVFETHATTDVAGTFGYVAPEYATTCRVSDKADVYSFGVVLLELISGKKSLDPSFSEYGNGFNIVAWATLLIKEGRFPELFSPELWEVGHRGNLLAMLKLASTCTAESLSLRPSMKQVLEKLQLLNS